MSRQLYQENVCTNLYIVYSINIHIYQVDFDSMALNAGIEPGTGGPRLLDRSCWSRFPSEIVNYTLAGIDSVIEKNREVNP